MVVPDHVPAQDRTGRLRWRLHELLETGTRRDWASYAVDGFLFVLIVANVFAFAAATVPWIAEAYGVELEWFNLVSVVIFTVEYIARLWVCVDLPLLREMRPWRARIKFAAMPFQIIDLAAILPFYLGNLFGIDLRILRVLRLLRFFKIVRYSPALQTLLRVVQTEAYSLIGALIIMLALILFASTAMYFIERTAQPEVFGSIPAAMWYALATLTTVGYGDVVPVTTAGRMVGGLFMVFGLALFALPIGILSSGFARENSRREFVITWNMVARVPLFARLSAGDVGRIMRLLQSHRYAAGTYIFRTDTPADSMYFIAAGEVDVLVSGDKPVTLTEGDHFGELALLEQRRRRVGAVARTDCHLLELDATEFADLMARHEDIARHIRAVAALRKQGHWQEGDPADPESGTADIPHIADDGEST